MADDPVKSYRDLRVWQKAMDIAEACYVVTRKFPKEEMYGMVSQIRRAAASVAANIAEGYGRDSSRSYAHFLRIAQGSLKELETHLLLSGRVRLTAQDSLEPILADSDSLGRMLRSLIRRIEASDERQTA